MKPNQVLDLVTAAMAVINDITSALFVDLSKASKGRPSAAVGLAP